MKLKLPLLLLGAVLACQSSPVAAYVADGVNINKINNSERFYEVGKGAYWWGYAFNPDNKAAIIQAMRTWDTPMAAKPSGNYGFLGELWDYIPILPINYHDTETWGSGAFIALNFDSYASGAAVASSSLQYWQTYYGIFYKGDQREVAWELPMGYNYHKSYLSMLDSTQALQIYSHVHSAYEADEDLYHYLTFSYEALSNSGDVYTSSALSMWRVDGNDIGSITSTYLGHYFKEFYQDGEAPSVTEEVAWDSLEQQLATGMGLSRGSDGSYSVETVGQLVGLRLTALEMGKEDAKLEFYGHALTCYGFEAGKEGEPLALWVADADDHVYGLQKLYVKEVEGALRLYTDAGCTKEYTSQDATWELTGISYIQTPQVLKELYAEYTGEDTPLVWTGTYGELSKNGLWGKEPAAAYADLPTEETGWDVYVGEGTDFAGYYHTFYQAGRSVLFGDQAQGSKYEGKITVLLPISVAGMTVDNNQVDYAFSGTFNGNAIATSSLEKRGSGHASLVSLRVDSPTTRIEGGALELGAWAELHGSSAVVGEEGELVLSRLSHSSAISGLFSLSGDLQVDGTLSVLAPSRSSARHVYGSETATLSFLVTSSATSRPLLSLDGRMEWEGQVVVTLDSSVGNREADYVLVSTTGGMSMGNLYRYSMSGGTLDGTKYYTYLGLSADQNDLLLSVRRGVSLFWKGGSGTWDGKQDHASWSRVPSGAEPWVPYLENTHVATFLEGSGDIQVTEEVKTQILRFEQCSYNLEGAGHIQVAEQLSVSANRDSASVVMDEAPVMGAGASLMIVGGQASLTISSGDWRVGSLYNEGQLTLSDGSLELASATRFGGSVSLGGDLTLAASSENTFTQLVMPGEVRYHKGKAGQLTVGDGSSLGSIQGGRLVVDSGHASLTGSGTTSLAGLAGGGSLSVLQHLALSGDSQLGGDLSVGGRLSLEGTAKLHVEGALSSHEIQLTQFGDPLIRCGSLAGPVDFCLEEEDLQVLRDWGLACGDQVVVLEADAIAGSLSVNGQQQIRVGAYDYEISVSSSQDVVLEAALAADVVHWQGQTTDTSSSASWSVGREPLPDETLALSGMGGEDVCVAASGLAASELVVDSVGKDYELSGEGEVSLGRLTVSRGGLAVDNEGGVEVTGKVLVGGKGVLEVASSLRTSALEVRPEGTLVNRGQLVVEGALLAADVAVNGGTLTVGDGTSLGALSVEKGGSRGNLVVGNGKAYVETPGNAVADLEIAKGASLTLGGDMSVSGAWTSEGALLSRSAVVLEQATSQGGSLQASSLTLKGQQNAFTSLTVDQLNLEGDLSGSLPLLEVEGAMGALSANGPVTVALADTQAENGAYQLIRGDQVRSVRYLLDLKTLHAYISQGVGVELRSSAEGVSVVVGDSDPSIYRRFLSSSNGQAGGQLLDGVFVKAFPQENAAAYPDLSRVMSALDSLLAAGATGEADRLAAAVAGASNAALGMASLQDMQRQLRTIRNRTTSMGVGSECSQPEKMPLYNAWVHAEGNRFTMKNSGADAGYELNSWGGTMGVDVDVSPSLTVGAAVSAMHGRFSSKSADVSRGDLDTEYLTLFARVSQKAWTHTFLFSAGWADASVRRTVSDGTGTYAVGGDTDGLSFGLMYEAGYTLPLDARGTVCWQPLFQLSWAHSELSGFTETGSDAALTVGDQTLDVVTAAIGARLQAAVGENIYNRTSLVECRALLKGDAGDRRSEAQVGMVSVPGAGQVGIRSAEMGSWGVELGAGMMTPLGARGGILFFDVSAEFRSDYRQVNGTVGYRMNF